MQFAVHVADLAVQLADTVAQLPDGSLDGGRVRSLLLEKTDLLGDRIALRFELLDVRQEAPSFFIELQDLANDGGILAPLLQSLANLVLVLPDAFDIQHAFLSMSFAFACYRNMDIFIKDVAKIRADASSWRKAHNG